MTTNRLRTALMGSGAAIALIAASGSAGADELQDLKSQIEALQGKVSELEAQNAEQGSPNVAPAAAVEAGDKPKSWKLPGTNTSMSIGGYAKLDFIYDINESALFGGQSTGFRAQPSPGAVGSLGRVQNRFRLHARQSRLFFKTWTPTDWGELATHIEGDFFGTGGTETISNSNSFRLRHAYGRLGPVLAGQTWTNFMDLRAFPEVIDFAGPNIPFIRQGQIRYSASFGGGTTLDVSLENPQATVTADTTVAAQGASLLQGDKLPDFTGRLTHAWSSGHIALTGVARYLSLENAGNTAVGAVNESAFGWGIGLSGTWVAGPTDRFGFYGNYGQGMGRYHLASFTSDSVLTGTTAANAELEAAEAWGIVSYWQHKWTDTIRTNLVGAFSEVNVEDEIPGKARIPAGTFDREWSVHANLIWSPVPQVNIGLEYQYRNSSFHNSTDGELSRFQMGFQYSF